MRDLQSKDLFDVVRQNFYIFLVFCQNHDRDECNEPEVKEIAIQLICKSATIAHPYFGRLLVITTKRLVRSNIARPDMKLDADITPDHRRSTGAGAPSNCLFCC